MTRPGNQATLGSGCVCDSGCEACDRLAGAFEAMREALALSTSMMAESFVTLGLAPFGAPEVAIIRNRAALALADKLSRTGQDPTRYAEHIKHGAGWKEPIK